MDLGTITFTLSPLPFGVLPFGHFRAGQVGNRAAYLSPLPFGVLPFGHPVAPLVPLVPLVPVSIAFRRSALRPQGDREEYRESLERVSIAFRRSALRPLRLPNCLADRGRRAVQVGTTAMSHFGSRWWLPVREVKLHKELRYGKLKFS